MASEQEAIARRKNNFDFEDLCLDPYQSHFNYGRSDGNTAGLQAGFDEGRSLGRRKALELGLELGYMDGVAKTIMHEVLPEFSSRGDDTESQRRVEKVRKGVTELIAAINAFPTPDEIFLHTRGALAVDGTDGTGKNDREDEVEDERVDVVRKMQRMRAKFKLISVWLKMPQLSLTRVMDEAANSDYADERTAKTSTEDKDIDSYIDGGLNKNKKGSEGHDW